MRPLIALIGFPLFIFAFVLTSHDMAAPGQKSAIRKQADKPPQTQPAKKNGSLRAPGFVFLELYTKDVAGYIDFFGKVAGFEPVHVEPAYAQIQSDCAEMILNGGNGPFGGKLAGHGQGVGVEIGIVVADLDLSFAAAKESGWKIGSPIQKRPWGVRDFRVFSPDGYYLRFTEPPKAK